MLKGLVPQMAGAMPAGALQFFAYEQTKTELNKLNKDVTLGGLRPHVTEICAAAIGAAAASIVRVPQERIKQPIQVRFENQSSPPLGIHSNQSGAVQRRFARAHCNVKNTDRHRHRHKHRHRHRETDRKTERQKHKRKHTADKLFPTSLQAHVTHVSSFHAFDPYTPLPSLSPPRGLLLSVVIVQADMYPGTIAAIQLNPKP